MKVEFATDPLFAAAVKDGVREALLDPDFRRGLFEHVAQAAANYVWLTRAEVAAMVGGRNEKTVARWAKKNLLEVNDKLGPKDPLYSLSSVHQALQNGAIRQKTAKPKAPVPASNGRTAPGTPLRSVTIAPNKTLL